MLLPYLPLARLTTRPLTSTTKPTNLPATTNHTKPATDTGIEQELYKMLSTLKRQKTACAVAKPLFNVDILRLISKLLPDPQTLSNWQLTCKEFRKLVQDQLFKLKLDWVYNNVEEVLGVEKTKQLRDGLLTQIHLYNQCIGVEGAKAIGEALKVNASLTEIYLSTNDIGDEGAKELAEALKVNTSLTKIHLVLNKIGDEG